MSSSTAGSSKGLVLIANYNQGEEIERFLKECLGVLPVSQMVVIDDGSSDGSDQIAKRLGFEVLRHEKNQGIGAAIRTGIEHAVKNNCEWVLISSSNGKMVPAEFPKIFGPIVSGEADYVQGSRFLDLGNSPGLPTFRKFAIPVFSFGVSMLLGRWFTDATCGLRAYKIAFLNDPRIDVNQVWLNRYELEYYIHYHAVRTAKLKIKELPVTIRYDHLGDGRRSKIQPIVGWWSMIRPFVLLSLRLKK